MKKIGMMFLAGAILFTPSFATFTDMDQTHWAYSSVEKMQNAGILSGYEDGSFKPSNNITLAEFATMFTKIFEIPQDNESNYFTDIPLNHWAKGYTEAVREYINPFYDSVGEFLGVTDYSYLKGLPGDIEMTREVFVYAVSKIYGYDTSLYTEGEEKLLFADYEEILYPKEMVLAYKNKVVSGEVIDGKTYIKPQRCITRAEASCIFANLLKYEQKRITNKGEEPQLNAAISDIVDCLKKDGISSVKDFVYDTQNILSSEKFVVKEELVSAIDELKNVVLNELEYEVVDKGFYSFNRGYVLVDIEYYDIFAEIEALINQEEDLEKKVKEIKQNISRNKVEKIKKQEILEFAKEDGEWKLILK